MKRPNFITKDNTAQKTLKAGLVYNHPKQPKRVHFPERSKKVGDYRKPLTLA